MMGMTTVFNCAGVEHCTEKCTEKFGKCKDCCKKNKNRVFKKDCGGLFTAAICAEGGPAWICVNRGT